MTRIDWNTPSKYYKYGIDFGILYSMDGESAAWNGLVRVEENTETPQLESMYFDGTIVNIKRVPSVFRAKVTAFTLPKKFEDRLLPKAGGGLYLSSRYNVQPFHFVYRVKTVTGYQIHLVYNCIFTLNEFTSATFSTSPEISPFVIDVVALPPTHRVVDYPKNFTRYNIVDPALLPPPPGADPSAWEDYLRNRYEEENGFPGVDLPDFDIDLDSPIFDIDPGFNDHIDLGNIAPSPHFMIDVGEADIGLTDALTDMLLGSPTLEPAFPTPQELLDLALGPNPFNPDLGGDSVCIDLTTWSGQPYDFLQEATDGGPYTITYPPHPQGWGNSAPATLTFELTDPVAAGTIYAEFEIQDSSTQAFSITGGPWSAGETIEMTGILNSAYSWIRFYQLQAPWTVYVNPTATLCWPADGYGPIQNASCLEVPGYDPTIQVNSNSAFVRNFSFGALIKGWFAFEVDATEDVTITVSAMYDQNGVPVPPDAPKVGNEPEWDSINAYDLATAGTSTVYFPNASDPLSAFYSGDFSGVDFTFSKPDVVTRFCLKDINEIA